MRLVRVLGALLCFLAIAVVALAILARTPRGRARVARAAERALARAGLNATCEDAQLELPPRVVMRNVRVPSTDAGRPAMEAKRVVIGLRTAPLFAGRLQASTVDIDAPTVHVEVEHGNVVNFEPAQGRTPGAPWPFDAVNVRDGRVEIAWGDGRAVAGGIEATARAQQGGGEIVVHAAGGHVERGEHEEAICSLDAALEIHPDAVVVRNLAAHGATRPGCSDPEDVTLTLDHARVALDADGHPSEGEGHVHARAAAEFLEHLAQVPRVAGRLELDGDVRLAPGSRLPELHGRLDAVDVAIGDVRLARSLHASVEIAHDEVRFPSATLDTIEGEVRVSDVTIHPFAHGVPVHGRVDGEHLRFEDFLRAIGVAKHPHVAWALDEVRWSDVAGTLEPFTLSGDLQLHTGGFTVHDAACDLRPCGRVWGFDRATLRGRATVDADGFEMRGVRGIDPGRRSLGGPSRHRLP